MRTVIVAQSAGIEEFLSIQAQDFIEDCLPDWVVRSSGSAFLSIQAQDFIEERTARVTVPTAQHIPEHSSSGLH